MKSEQVESPEQSQDEIDVILRTDVIIPCVDPRFFAIRRYKTGEFIIRRMRPDTFGKNQDNWFFGGSNVPLEILDKIYSINRLPLTSNVPKFDLIPPLKAQIPNHEDIYIPELNEKITKKVRPAKMNVHKKRTLDKVSLAKRSMVRKAQAKLSITEKSMAEKSKYKKCFPKESADEESLTVESISPEAVSQYIKEIFGHNKYDPTPSKRECKFIESSREFIEKEETQSSKIAKNEDSIERIRDFINRSKRISRI